MKKIKYILLYFLFLSQQSYGVIFDILGPCKQESAFIEEVDIFLPASVGEVSVFTFKIFDIPFSGDENSIKSILETPQGKDAIEYVSASHFRVYGWCYRINDKLVDLPVSQYILDPARSEHLQWFYGFSEFIEGEWVNMCEPLYQYPDRFICKQTPNGEI